jgi:hypothetical protein
LPLSRWAFCHPDRRTYGDSSGTLFYSGEQRFEDKACKLNG